NLSFITPNMADDGHDGATWDLWLPEYIHLIQASPAYRQDGAIIIVFDEQGGTGTLPSNNLSCCGEIPGPNSSSPGVGGPGVGDTGSVISTNTGTTWTASRSDTAVDLNGVSCPSGGSICVAVGDAGTVLKSLDGGLSWAPQPSGTEHDLTGVSCPTASSCYVV